MSFIMTVRGPIAPSELGFTLPHEHIFIDLTAFPGGITRGGQLAIIDPVLHGEIMVKELRAFQDVGGKSIVELTGRNMGGDIRALKRISELTGLHIIATCGWYRESYMEPDIYYRPTAQLAEELIHDIEHGLDGTDIRPGIIGEIGSDYSHSHFSAKEERCLRAMAKAQQRTGLAITTHLTRGKIGFELLDILAEHHVPPERVIIGHSDLYLNLDYHAALMKRGAYVQFDNIGSGYDAPHGETDLARHIAELIRQGYVERILLSHDICWRSRLKHYGGTGFDYLVTHFFPMLKAAGVSDEAIHIMTVENPARVLTIS